MEDESDRNILREDLTRTTQEPDIRGRQKLLLWSESHSGLIIAGLAS